MKTIKKLTPFRILILLLLCGKISFSQNSNLIAETHNLLLDNSLKDKTIQIRIHNCSKEEFETIYKKAILNSDLVLFNKAYSAENKIGSFYFSKNKDINTSDVEALLKQLNISKIIFNEKKILVAELSNYHFTNKEMSNSLERIEK